MGLLLLTAIGTGWIVYEYKQSHLGTTQPTDHNPDGFIRGAVITDLTPQGQPKLQLLSPKLLHYPDKSTDMTTPHFVLYADDGGAPWHIYAQYGRALNGMEALLLWDQVKIERAASAKNEETTILTSELNIYPDQKLITSDKKVTLIQPGTRISSVGVRAYQDGRVELLSNVRGEHASKDNSSMDFKFLPDS